jgi:hypothetical protein
VVPPHLPDEAELPLVQRPEPSRYIHTLCCSRKRIPGTRDTHAASNRGS